MADHRRKRSAHAPSAEARTGTHENPLPLASSSRPPPQGGRQVIDIAGKVASPSMREAGAKRSGRRDLRQRLPSYDLRRPPRPLALVGGAACSDPRRSPGRPAFMLSLTLPRSSKPSTLTLTWSPILTTSATLPTRCGASSLIWTSPSRAAEEIHEGAEVDDLDDLAVVDHADFRLGDDAADPVDGGLRGRSHRPPRP